MSQVDDAHATASEFPLQEISVVQARPRTKYGLQFRVIGRMRQGLYSAADSAHRVSQRGIVLGELVRRRWVLDQRQEILRISHPVGCRSRCADFYPQFLFGCLQFCELFTLRLQLRPLGEILCDGLAFAVPPTKFLVNFDQSHKS
ncbi:MAG: hypothetical protein ACLP9L_05295 [Thermoguttaceae bacterium]